MLQMAYRALSAGDAALEPGDDKVIAEFMREYRIGRLVIDELVIKRVVYQGSLWNRLKRWFGRVYASIFG